MSTVIFANNATTTIASGINAAAVSVTLATGQGALFPNPGAGEYFIATFVDDLTGLVNEIVKCTARSGDVVTIVRAQEGTTAHIWATGDHFNNYWTAGQAEAMAQQVQLQSQSSNYAVDSGTTNALVITLDPAPTSLADLLGAPIRVNVANTNTTVFPTINVNGFGAKNISASFGSATGAPVGVGTLIAGTIVELIWDGTQFQYIGMMNAATVAQVKAGSTNSAPITPFALAGAMASSLIGITANYQYLPSGLILQFGTFTTTSGINDTITFPVTFPNAVSGFYATGKATGGNLVVCAIGSGGLTTASAKLGVGITNTTPLPASGAGVTCYWLAIGY